MLARYVVCLTALVLGGAEIARGEEGSTCTESTAPEAYFAIIGEEEGPATPVKFHDMIFSGFEAIWPATAPTAVVPPAPGDIAPTASGEPMSPPQHPGSDSIPAPGSIQPGPSYTRGGLTRSQSITERPPVTSASELLERKRRERDLLDAEIRVLEQLTTPKAIIIHAQVIEISRSRLRPFAIDRAHFMRTTLEGETNFRKIRGVQQLVEVGLGKGDWVESEDGPFFAILQSDDPFFGLIKALEQNNVAKVQSDPMLVMFSGQSRSIRSGGKIPIPDPQGNGAYQFVEYGTHLTCRANILSDGRISLEVDSEVREIVDRDMLQVGGKTIPAVKSLSFQSAGVVGDEQALVIAGVVQERTETVEVSDPESEGGKRMEQRLDEVELLVVLRCEPFDKGRTTAQSESN